MDPLKSVVKYKRKLKSLELSDRKEMVNSEHLLSVSKQSILLDVPRTLLYYESVKK